MGAGAEHDHADDSYPADDSPPADDLWDWEERHETPTERLDRNWAELLQELRVVQTGVQLLTGFLLTLPFQSQFSKLSARDRNVYLYTVGAAVVATCFLIAPVALHRTLFRRHARRITVAVAHRLAVIGMALFGAAMVGVVLLIFDVVRSTTAGLASAIAVLVLLLSLWVALPLYLRQSDQR